MAMLMPDCCISKVVNQSYYGERTTLARRHRKRITWFSTKCDVVATRRHAVRYRFSAVYPEQLLPKPFANIKKNHSKSLRIRKLPRAICTLDQLAAYRYWLSMSVPIDERRSRLMIFIVTASSVVRLHFTQRSDLQSTAIDIGHCEGTGST
ncbi:unnamed protein product [Trichogramma brassicae]|uniref:Uncharacterized protein n=1 Tax=Trichogramma brassicae TaxID=86971 RepID=A0A6H5J5S3_9HYME|nr:unnamed protein product [Trichogramma brassicae]